MIKSLLDQDFYAFSQGQLALHKFSSVDCEYKFKCRSPNIVWTQDIVNDIRWKVSNFCSLRFTKEELDYLRNIPVLKKDYIDFLK